MSVCQSKQSAHSLKPGLPRAQSQPASSPQLVTALPSHNARCRCARPLQRARPPTDPLPASLYVHLPSHLFPPRPSRTPLSPLEARIPPLPVCRSHILYGTQQPSGLGCTVSNLAQSPHSPEKRLAFWNATAGNALRTLLDWTSYPQHLRTKYDAFFTAYIIPRLGPSPHMIDDSRLQSQLQDDHTPLEFSCVLESDACGKVQCYAEPLNPLDGSSTPRETWMANLHNMLVAAEVRDADLSWCRMCADTLTVDAPPVLPDSDIHIQFAMGTPSKFISVAYKSSNTSSRWRPQ